MSSRLATITAVLASLVASSAQAGTWGRTWGSMTWGRVAETVGVPVGALPWLALLAGVLAWFGLNRLRKPIN